MVAALQPDQTASEQPATLRQTPTDRGVARRIVGRAAAIGLTGLAIYVLLPSLTRVVSAWPQLSHLSPLWLIGSHPRPSLVLLAYAAAGVLALVPITPGGLGVVEASLSGLFILAGIPGGKALVATLAYRLASYWLPLLAGLLAYVLFRRRYPTATTNVAKPRGPDGA
jgi:uncharacterized membrane protein YbhN (UPF0104 family)